MRFQTRSHGQPPLSGLFEFARRTSQPSHLVTPRLVEVSASQRRLPFSFDEHVSSDLSTSDVIVSLIAGGLIQANALSINQKGLLFTAASPINQDISVADRRVIIRANKREYRIKSRS